MKTVRKLKVYCDDKEFYSFFKKEQREQNKALNLAIGYLHTNAILKGNDSASEVKINNSIKKLEDKITKLKLDLEKPKITEKKKEQVLKAIKTNEDIIKDNKVILEENKSYRTGLDKQFSELYTDKTNLYHVLKSSTSIQYMRTIELVRDKVGKDYRNNFNDIITGKISLINYKQDNPLMMDSQNINLFKQDNDYYIGIMLGFELKVVLGQRKNENIEELRKTLDKCIDKDYTICQSSIQRDKNDNIIFNLTIDIPENNQEYKPVDGKTLGVDLGIKYPAYICLSDDTYKRQHLGSIEDFLKVREQMQKREQNLKKNLKLAKGGKGRNKKLQALDRLKDKERNWVKTYNHTLSKNIVEFAKKHKCEYINIEKLTKDGFDERILRNWSYYELQNMIKYKADREGIKVRYVSPAYTSQTCSNCSNVDKDNRQTQDKFVCTECGFGLTHGFKDKNKNIYVNADHNAAINISRSTEFVK